MEYIPLWMAQSRKMLSLKSNTTYIWSFRNTGYIFQINSLIRYQALYKKNSKNKMMTHQFKYICCVICVPSHIMINIAIEIVVVKIYYQG
jgi:hypothetical protein